MLPSGMICRVALVRTDILDEHITSIIRVTRIAKLGTALTAINQHMLRRNVTSVVTRAKWRNIPEDSILHNQHHENLKSYIHKAFGSIPGNIFPYL
jgi:hypothetical protein